MKTIYNALVLSLLVLVISCSEETENTQLENPATFAQLDDIDLGDSGAAEISAYDPQSKKLFVVNNDITSRIDIVDMSDVTLLELEGSIDITPYGASVQSVSVKNGLLAAAIGASTKTDNGVIVIFNTSDLSEEAVVGVGALPDMVTFSPDGNFIVSANEGEPASDYSVDPLGTISIIDVKNNFTVSTLNFNGFAGDLESLKNKGYRVFGPEADLSMDTEPEYVAISDDSKTAWVTLQENNGVAKVDLVTKSITTVFPLGYKDHNSIYNEIDASNSDGGVKFFKWPVKGMYLPDAIAAYQQNGNHYFITANEGDVREYDTYVENVRVSTLLLDPTIFPTGDNLKAVSQLGRLNVTTAQGDTDNDGDYDELFSYGARSFSIWNGETGELVYDCGNDLEQRVIINSSLYDDGRSDDKGVEPEGVVVAKMSGRIIAFIALERADAVAIYDITNVTSPTFIKLIPTGDAPEGILFISATDSPNGKSLLIVSSENDGLVKVYQPE
jgi:hypothetical protein